MAFKMAPALALLSYVGNDAWNKRSYHDPENDKYRVERPPGKIWPVSFTGLMDFF